MTNEHEDNTYYPVISVPAVAIRYGDEDEQLGTFANATMATSRDGKWVVSIATVVDLPGGLKYHEVVSVLNGILGLAAVANQPGSILFDVMVGKASDDDGDDGDTIVPTGWSDGTRVYYDPDLMEEYEDEGEEE